MKTRLGLVIAAALAVAGCGAHGSSSDNGGGEQHAKRPVTVYEIDGLSGGVELVPVRLRVSATNDPLRDAVNALIAHEPSGKGLSSLWSGMCRPGDGFESARVTNRLVTVALKEFPPKDTTHAVCDLTRKGAIAQRQQIAWTVRAATDSTAPVKVTADDGYVVIARTRALQRYLR